MKVISLFAGCGGLDLGFKKADFDIIWANEYDRNIWETYEKNHQATFLEKRSIIKVKSEEIPDCQGIIGGPPCQSWSTAGMGRGIEDSRGKLFMEYVRVVNDKNPLFFVAENVKGILAPRHQQSWSFILDSLETAGIYGYNIVFRELNAWDYDVPQDRKRIFIVGYRKDLNISFNFPEVSTTKPTVEEIRDLVGKALPAQSNRTNADKCVIPNHEYWIGTYSYIFMSRNRVLSWNKPSYTIQATERQVSIHPDSPPMVKIEKDVMKFVEGKEKLYRRLSIRECARIQTFPDDFIFHYDHLSQGYKMIGNAVPVNLAFAVAHKVYNDLYATLAATNLKSKKMTVEIS